MKPRRNELFEMWLGILIAVLAIFALRSIFANDNSKIVSKRGKKYLTDDKKMQDINDKILDSEKSNHHQDIII
jgi:hypothetical protein